MYVNATNLTYIKFIILTCGTGLSDSIFYFIWFRKLLIEIFKKKLKRINCNINYKMNYIFSIYNKVQNCDNIHNLVTNFETCDDIFEFSIKL